jgi:hypothetical protein
MFAYRGWVRWWSVVMLTSQRLQRAGAWGSRVDAAGEVR